MRFPITALLFFSAIATPSLLHAGVWTVSNNPGQPAQFTSPQDAMDAASPGDTLYFAGSSTVYNNGGTMYIRKRLTFIGPGYTPLPATLPRVTLDTIASVSGASGSTFIGLKFNVHFDGANFTNITIDRCHVVGAVHAQTSGQTLKQWTVTNSYLEDIVSGGQTSFGGGSAVVANISNCILRGRVSSVSDLSTIVVSNCIFLGTGTQTAFSNVANAVISNNIFWGTSPVGTDVEDCAFNNNITYQTPNNTIPFGSNVGSGNLIGVNPQFVNAPDQTINFSYDYRLQAGSPGVGAGTDGTDIGIYGGQFPMPNMTGAPRIPVITQFTLQNTTIGEGGSLNVEVKARKND